MSGNAKTPFRHHGRGSPEGRAPGFSFRATSRLSAELCPGFKFRRNLEQEAAKSTDLAICTRRNPKLKPAFLAKIMAPTSLAFPLTAFRPLGANFAHRLGPIR